MASRVFIVTGGLRGLGRAMTVGLIQDGHRVVAVGHLPEDVEPLRLDPKVAFVLDRLEIVVTDIRIPQNCDLIIATALKRFGQLDGLINNAGLTFTYISPGRGLNPGPRFWEIPDEIVQNIMNTNFVAAAQMAGRVARVLIPRGWGRIINVTTKLETMNRPGTTPYGSSKAALEISSEVWAKEIAGTGVTVNILNPGAGAFTPGMDPEMQQASRDGKIGRFVDPEQMVPPLLWLVSPDADRVNGARFDANAWDPTLPPAQAAAKSCQPAGFDPKTGPGL